MKPLVISFSGGKTSAFMSAMLFDLFAHREKVVVFANTGLEHEKTLQFVHDCDRAWGLNVVWVEAEVNDEHGVATTHRIVDFDTASRNGEPFERMIEKYGIPNVSYPHCTRELKQRPIHSYVKSLGWAEYETAIGIRSDEIHRINRKEAEKNDWIYPLETASDVFLSRQQKLPRD